MEFINNLVNTLSNQVGTIIPGVIGALLTLIIGFFVAKIFKKITLNLLGKSKLDEKLTSKLGSGIRLDQFLAKLVYYLVILYTLIIVLNMLGVTGVLEPLNDMLNKFLSFIPNLIAAGIICFAGYMIAKIVSEATHFVSERIENYISSKGISMGSINIPKLIKQIVFIFVFIPILIVALDTLQMYSISEPAKDMMASFLSAVPKIVAAAILLGLFYFIGKYIVSFIVELAKNLGLDDFAEESGISKLMGSKSFSSTLGNIALFFVMFLGTIAAVDKLELIQISNILHDVFNLTGNIFFGMIIMFVGVFLSNKAQAALAESKENSWMATFAKFVILGLFFAFALHTIGIAQSIVNLVVGLTFGAVAVAFALSFGLGGRKAAGRQLDHIFNRIRNEN
ncbi:MAG: mechanosensitive ion channel [Maribacter sp.]|nr:mechanosensitive ion channel [Maribacter sp.]